MTEKAVFLDRDGVVNQRGPWVFFDPTRLPLVEGAPRAMARLSNAGYRVIIVTNQPWVGYGVLSEDKLDAFHASIRDRVEDKGGRVDAAYACPHRPGEGCICRKPGTGMLEKARDAFELDPEQCWMVGDKPSDIQAGRAFGARTVWVTGERFPWERFKTPARPDATVEALPEAVETILASSRDQDL